MKHLSRSIFALLALLSLGTAAQAEVSVRECIRIKGSSELSYRIQPMTTVDLISMDFNLLSASDGIFNVTVFHQDSPTPPLSRLRYNVVIDGGNSYRVDVPKEYFARTPAVTDGTAHFQVHFKDIPAGTHTATVRVNNTSATAADVAGAWISPLFVDATEGSASAESGSISIGASYVQLAGLTSPALSNRHLILGAYVRGSAAGAIQLRYKVNGTVVETLQDNFRNVDDGVFFPFTVQNAAPGATVTLEALGPATITATELTAQTIQPYSMIEGVQNSSVSVANDGTLNTVFSSPETTLNALSLSGPQCCQPGHYQACIWGNAFLEMSMPDSSEGEWQMWWNGKHPGETPFEIGASGISLDPLRDSFRHMPDVVCGVAFFGAGTTYRIDAKLKGLAPFGSCAQTPITVHRGRLQVFVLPAPVLVPSGGDPHTCNTSWKADCAYQCAMNPALPRSPSAPARNFCN